MDENLCVCCGAQIPEGRQVCQQCEARKTGFLYYVSAYKDGRCLGFSEGNYMECSQWGDIMISQKGANEININRKE